MYWYKVKSALIILFLAINLFLLGRIGLVAFNQQKSQRENLSSVISILQHNNVTVAESTVPSADAVLPALSVKNALADEEVFVSSVMGKGILLYDENTGIYTSGSKTLRLDGSRFYYRNSSAGSNITPNAENAAVYMARLSEMGFYTDEAIYTMDTTRISYRLTPGGNHLFDTEIIIIPGEYDIISASGSWGTPTIDPETETRLRPVSDALIEFYRDPARPDTCEIQSVRAGYSMWLGNDAVNYKTADAIPVWRIRLTNNQSFYYDAR